jgi:hypothetical protein
MNRFVGSVCRGQAGAECGLHPLDEQHDFAMRAAASNAGSAWTGGRREALAGFPECKPAGLTTARSCRD